MEEIRMITGILANFSFVFMMYLVMGRKITKWGIKNYRKLALISFILSVVFGIISLILGYCIYNSIDILLFFGGIIYLMFGLLILTAKNRKKLQLMEIKAGTYEVNSTVNLVGATPKPVYLAKGMMRVKKEDGYIFYKFNSGIPKLNKNLIVCCFEVEPRVYNVSSYMYDEKVNILDILNLLVNFYVMFMYSYGTKFMSLNGLLGIQSEENIQLVTLPICYAIFKVVSGITKNGRDLFTKFMHFVFVIMYIWMLIILLFSIFIPITNGGSYYYY